MQYTLDNNGNVVTTSTITSVVDVQSLINEFTQIQNRGQTIANQLTAIGQQIPSMADTVSVVPAVATQLQSIQTQPVQTQIPSQQSPS